VRARALAFAALVLGACARRPPPPDLSMDPALLLGQVREAQARVVSIQGEATVRVESPDFSGALRQWIAAEKPDRLHVEALDFFGNPAAVMVTDGGRFALYDARARVLYRGEATPENLSRLVPVALTPEELATVLCGSAPIAAAVPAAAEAGDGVVRLRLEAAGRIQTLDVGARAAVERSRLRGADGARVPGAVDLSFAAFQVLGTVRFPREVKLASEGPHVEVRLAWREPELNAPVDPALFRLEPPRGARVVDLAPGEAPPETLPSLPPGEQESAPPGRPRG
jgi:hypothetical protein